MIPTLDELFNPHIIIRKLINTFPDGMIEQEFERMGSRRERLIDIGLTNLCDECLMKLYKRLTARLDRWCEQVLKRKNARSVPRQSLSSLGVLSSIKRKYRKPCKCYDYKDKEASKVTSDCESDLSDTDDSISWS